MGKYFSKQTMMEESETKKAKIQFKSIKKKRPIRQKDSSSDEENDNSNEVDNKDAFEEILEIQKLRKRSHGVNSVTLASGKKVSKVDELVSNDADPFKLKSGGLLSLDKAKKAAEIEKAEENGENIGTQFSKETRVRDEDEEMQKFIEKEMEK